VSQTPFQRHDVTAVPQEGASSVEVHAEPLQMPCTPAPLLRHPSTPRHDPVAKVVETLDGRAIHVVIVGEPGVGKTTFLSRCLGIDCEMINATSGRGCTSFVYPLAIDTNRGRVQCYCKDTGGIEKYGGLRDKFYSGSNAAIIVLDVSSRASINTLPNWQRDVARVCEGVPIVVVGNKLDSIDRPLPPAVTAYCQRKGVEYVEVSRSLKDALMMPFLMLARILFHDPSLALIPAPHQGDELP
jgi:GTP-binding nuclear protein Ran